MLAVGVLIGLAAAAAQTPRWEPLRFEAETCSGPADAWAQDKALPAKWNLWTTDPAGDKVWSGGRVLQAPAVEADRSTPEEGVAPLHTLIRDIPPGLYDVEVKVARTVAVATDGVSWQRFAGGFLQRGVRIEGTYELWVDDRYAHVPPGPCYYDCVVLHPVPPLEKGLYNPSFELGAPDQLVGWQFNAAGGGATAASEDSTRPGAGRCLRIQDPSALDPYYGGTNWSLRNTAALPVQPGQSCVIRAWVQAERNPYLMVTVEGWQNGTRVARQVGSTHASGAAEWHEIAASFTVPEGIETLAVMVQGKSACNLRLDDLALTVGTLERAPRPKVKGWARERVQEPLDRGLVAVPSATGVYLSWRLLPSDAPDAAFDVYRRLAAAAPLKLNQTPVTRTCDYLDTQPAAGADAVYTVRLRQKLRPDRESPPATWCSSERGLGFVRIPLAEPVMPSKAGVGDLDGDGRLDVVIKYPGHTVWCWNEAGKDRWERSPDTYKLEAYSAAGRRLWRNDLGWGIEQGLWYSPYLVHDLDGDGAAEVAVKTADGDPRNAEGRVISGNEWVSIWNGRTGAEIARAPWPEREGFESYDHFCRHYLAVAYLDGKTPCLLVQRGNYGRMVVDAYQLRAGKLEKLWRYDNQDFGGIWWGQGAHWLQIGDLEGDGRDEIVLGSAAIDDDGTPLWSIGKGHPDYVFMGDIDPAHPGWEVFLGLEPPQPRGGNICLDAATGRMLWELAVPTNHVGVEGMCSDIDPTAAGLESQALDVNAEKRPAHAWLWGADGRILRESERAIGTPWTAWWDADLQRELVRGAVTDFDGAPLSERLAGTVLLVADLFGDWREEILCAAAGELRLYTTSIPATDRRPTLLADPLYRNGVALYAMGYPQVPLTSACLEATSPGLNLTVRRAEDGAATCRVVVSAARSAALQGRLVLRTTPGTPVPGAVDVALAAGERQTLDVALTNVPPNTPAVAIEARLDAADTVLTGQAFIEDRRPRVGVALAEAESFTAQGGGEVKIRDAKDKPGVHGGKCLSHWFNPGHWLEWQLPVPKGRYHLALRYCAGADVTRALSLNSQSLPPQRFRGTGGFGENGDEWDTHVVGDAAGTPLVLEADGTTLTVRLEAPGGDAGVNLDYLTLLPAP
jgi:rhamnogalacturonan endolyase